MVEVFNAHVFHTKVIDNEAELDWLPFVAPETRSGSRFVVAFGFETPSILFGMIHLIGKGSVSIGALICRSKILFRRS